MQKNSFRDEIPFLKPLNKLGDRRALTRVCVDISFLGYHDLIFQTSFLFQNLVNELIKNFIIFHEDIFKGRVAGTVYEKYLTPEPEEVLGDSPLDANNPEFIDSEVGEDGKALFVFQFLISWHYTYWYQDSIFFCRCR